ncbi:hypothetical protein L3X38_032623 [Prunus dulcis]|uniref:Uncharacterized protein n=1 Tax=Prunus dulcis TaxID=3755 RepID=A0AAD4VGK4_PRUDU|nr:hypothetical protein L3X38_032623 [Prunus dulcis]
MLLRMVDRYSRERREKLDEVEIIKTRIRQDQDNMVEIGSSKPYDADDEAERAQGVGNVKIEDDGEEVEKTEDDEEEVEKTEDVERRLIRLRMVE